MIGRGVEEGGNGAAESVSLEVVFGSRAGRVCKKAAEEARGALTGSNAEGGLDKAAALVDAKIGAATIEAAGAEGRLDCVGGCEGEEGDAAEWKSCSGREGEEDIDAAHEFGASIAAVPCRSSGPLPSSGRSSQSGK